METKDLIKICIVLVIIMMTGFEIGYLSHSLIQTTININAGNYSFDIGQSLNQILNKTLDKVKIPEFSCSTMWYDFGLKCNGTKFVNITGMYCNDILVCQNSR